MKIVICGSTEHAYQIKEMADKLKALDHETEIPFYSQKILAGETPLEDFKRIKEERGDAEFREKSPEDLIKRYHRLISEADAILILNIDKKGIKNYIGGNVFLEMGFAHVLDKKIFLLNDIPEMPYLDELKAMKPIVLNGDLTKIM